jgi:hypothetical protein
MDSSCSEGYNHFINKYFKDCVYGNRDMAGFCLGIASILFWAVAQVPQLVKNHKQQSVEGLSAYFLAEWLLVGRVLSWLPIPHTNPSTSHTSHTSDTLQA